MLTASARGANYHVVASPKGSDDGMGTKERPWRTLTHAARNSKPGDTVWVHGGVIPLEAREEIRANGEPGRWITFAAAPGETPILDASGVRPSNLGDASHYGAITFQGASWIRLVGLRLRNSHFAGIMIHKPGHHIDIAGCRIDSTFAPGIGAWNVADVRVIGCEVTGANTQRMRLFGDPKRECPHEAISIAGVDRFDVTWNHVHHCDKEGIDVKEVSRHGTVHHNYVHDLPRQGLYADAWFGLLEDVEFASNVVHDCEWGIVLSVEGKDSVLRDVRIHHNLLYRSRGSGIFFGTWGSDGPRSGILIENNTLWANGTTDHWAGPTGSIDIRSKNIRDLLVARNLCARGGAFEIATFIDPSRRPEQFIDLRIRLEDNLVGSRRDATDGPIGYGRVYVEPGQGALIADPRLFDPDAGDFRPRTSSPALDRAGYAGVSEAMRHAGAFGPRARKLPPVSSRLTDFPTHRVDRSGWPNCLRP